MESAGGKASTNVPWETVPQSPTVVPHGRADAGKMPGASAPPSMGRMGASHSQKVVGDARWARVCCPADLWDVRTQTKSEQGQEDGVQSALTVNPWEDDASVIIILFRAGPRGLISYLGEAVVATLQMSFISEFPEAEGGTSTDSQLGKEIWKHFRDPGQLSV